MPPPPELVQRVPRPPVLVAVLLAAGALASVLLLVRGVVVLVEAAAVGREGDAKKAVRCQVLPTAPVPLPPGRWDASFRRLSVHLSFDRVDGTEERAIDCQNAFSMRQPLRIAYSPAALGLPATGAAALACSVGGPAPYEADRASLVFADDANPPLKIPVVCPGGTRADRPLRIEYEPHQLGLSARSDVGDPEPRGDSGYAVAAVMIAIGGFFLGAIAWGWCKTRLV